MTLEEAYDIVSSVKRPLMQWPGEIAWFVSWLTQQRNVHDVLEIGTGEGGSAELWCKIATGRVVSVDVWSRVKHQVHKSLSADFPQFVGIGCGDKRPGVPNVERALGVRKVDLLFVDGNHRSAGVLTDLTQYHQFVRADGDGVIALHDICVPTEDNHVPLVWRAFRPFLRYPVEFVRSGSPWGGIGAWKVEKHGKDVY